MSGVIPRGRFVWYDLFTHDVEGASSFYHDLFGWEFESTPEYGNFSLARQDGVPVAGLVRIDEARAACSIFWSGRGCS